MKAFRVGRTAAFTLIELLAVIAIIAALAALSLVLYPKMSGKIDTMEKREGYRQKEIEETFEKTNGEKHSEHESSSYGFGIWFWV